jgi:hypothetical protein
MLGSKAEAEVRLVKNNDSKFKDRIYLSRLHTKSTYVNNNIDLFLSLSLVDVHECEVAQ